MTSELIPCSTLVHSVRTAPPSAHFLPPLTHNYHPLCELCLQATMDFLEPVRCQGLACRFYFLSLVLRYRPTLIILARELRSASPPPEYDTPVSMHVNSRARRVLCFLILPVGSVLELG
ncbi:hypothetical protein PLICRDRAFT_339021 [Plicaturopsis crispa FD-325 SS-3]|uniref:Uncharacterized protein n=1 Tax=Plicaturopsis crispa FD-325 SS-3 TaxID=944288 RepID=A0A0C9SLD7_PLICR|nr:hypothetical protein PLICRDRAFT_339021 [Plicaturopsis crispa FD-325 SS-3]